MPTIAGHYRLVLCSCPSVAVAKALADKVLRARLVACVNIGPQSTSMYWWQDHLHSEEEVVLSMKTTAAQMPALTTAITEAHPYEVPEIIALPIIAGHEPYLSWLDQVTQAEPK